MVKATNISPVQAAAIASGKDVTDIDAEPGEATVSTEGTPGGETGPLEFLKRTNPRPLSAFEGVSIRSIIGQYDRHLDRAIHTATKSGPGALWLDLVFGLFGGAYTLIFGDKSGINAEPGEEKSESNNGDSRGPGERPDA